MAYSNYMKKYLLLFYALFVLHIAFTDDSFLEGKIIVGVEDTEGYPPFVYINKGTGEYEGYSVDLLNLVFEGSGAKIRYNLLPWERCLIYVKEGDKADIILVAASTEERRRQFLFSDSIAEVHLGYFYDKRRFPNGLGIEEPDDFLKIGAVRGMTGYVYEHYGIPKKIFQKAGSFQKLVEQLIHKRCDAILVRYEVFNSFQKVYPDFEGLEYIEGEIIPWRKDNPIQFYFLSAKNSEYHSNLINYINRKMVELNENGELKKIKEKFGFKVE